MLLYYCSVCLHHVNVDTQKYTYKYYIFVYHFNVKIDKPAVIFCSSRLYIYHSDIFIKHALRISINHIIASRMQIAKYLALITNKGCVSYSHRNVKYDAEWQMNLMNGFLMVCPMTEWGAIM